MPTGPGVASSHDTSELEKLFGIVVEMVRILGEFGQRAAEPATDS